MQKIKEAILLILSFARLFPSHGPTGSYSEPEVGFGEVWSILAPLVAR
jgi:hypothetical protein